MEQGGVEETFYERCPIIFSVLRSETHRVLVELHCITISVRAFAAYAVPGGVCAILSVGAV